jgi:hypothetical protein
MLITYKQDIDYIYLQVKHSMLIHTDRVGFICNKLENRRSRSFDISSVTLPRTILGEVW